MVTECNQAAFNWIERWPDWPYPALIMVGPKGAGKSHLGAVWQAKNKLAHSVLPSENTADISGTHFLIDSLEDFLGDAHGQDVLFHLFNRARNEQGSMLIIAQTPPQQLDFTLPDLASRLRAAPVAMINSPDDALLAALLVKLFADRQIDVSEKVIAYAVPRLERSFQALEDFVMGIDCYALARKSPVTVPLIGKYFEESL